MERSKKIIILLVIILIAICGIGLITNYSVSHYQGVEISWVVKSGAPTSKNDLKVGTMYLDKSTYDIYQKTHDGWIFVGNISGKDAVSPTISISNEGFWIINEVNTGVKATFDDKDIKVPEIDVNSDGYLTIDGENTTVKIENKNGADGKDGVDGKDGADGKDGKDGNTPVIKINESGYWVINDQVTPVLAKGENGLTPSISINNEGYWMINEEVTSIKAEAIDGTNGKDGTMWYVGEQYPSSPKESDIFLDVLKYDIYQYKNEEWKNVGNINGTSILFGNINPTTEFGNEGDLYLNTLTYDMFAKENNSWNKIGNIKGADGKDATVNEDVINILLTDYLDNHPELLTTVNEKSLTSVHMTGDVLEILHNNGLQNIEWILGKRVTTSMSVYSNDQYTMTSSAAYFNVGDKLEVADGANVRIKYGYYGTDGESYDANYSSVNSWKSTTINIEKEGYYQFSVSFVPTSTTAITADNKNTLLSNIDLASSYILGLDGSIIQSNSIPLRALGNDIYTEILRYDYIYRQSAYGGISFGMGIVPNTTNKGIVKKDSTILLADSYNQKQTTAPSVSTAYGRTFPSGDDITSTTRSDISVVGDEIWVWGVAPDDHSKYATVWRLKYDPASNTLREEPKFFWHNFGHVNAVNYNPQTDSLILGNGSSDYGLENKIYIIYNVTDIINSNNGAVFDYKDYAIEIDAGNDIYNFGAKLNVFWTNAKTTKYNYSMTQEQLPNTAFAYANDVNKFYILAFGTGTNKYKYGTYVEPTDGQIWNGTFNVLAEYDSGDPNEVIGASTSYEHCGQGGDAIDGVAFVGLGHSDYWWREINVENSTDISSKDTWLPSFNYSTGELSNEKIEGIAVTSQYLIVMSSGTITYIPR